MRYAFFSDVHGNLEALSATLDFLRRQSIDRYVFLGDAVGYGASPNEVCDLIRPLAHHAVLGNHDAAAVGRMSAEHYYSEARESILWSARRLKDDNREWLRMRPYTSSEGRFGFCHGSPGAPERFDYLLTTHQVEALCKRGVDLASVTFIGHSHLALVFRVQDSKVTSIVDAEVDVCDGARYIITVGSVGQPRDHDPRACCCTLDEDEGILRFHRLEYDIEGARRKIHDVGLSQAFGDRLVVGI